MGRKYRSNLTSLTAYLVEKGLKVQQMFPEVVQYYRESNSLERIAIGLIESDESEIAEIFGGEPNVGTLANTIKMALKGNLDAKVGLVYEGLMPLEEYDSISYKHKHSHGAQTQKKLRIGIHAQTRDELRDNALKAATARGEKPWEDYEIVGLQALMRDKDFRTDIGYKVTEIQEKLNFIYHCGEQVRSIQAIREKIRVETKKLAKSSPHILPQFKKLNRREWTQEELAHLTKMIANKDTYGSRTGYNAKLIATTLNATYYDSQPVRTVHSVREKIKGLTKKD